MYIRGRAFSSLILGLSLILVGCSSNPEVEDKKETLTGECSQEEISGGSAWITGQLNAFSNSDAKAAYAFASEQFRSGVSLDEFASIIAGQYSALLNLETFEIINCVPIEMGFVFQVDLTDKEKNLFTVQYVLSLIEGQWGVDAATISQVKAKPSL